MKNLKRLSPLLCALALVIVLFSCSKDNTDPQEDPPADQNVPTCSFTDPSNNSTYEIGDVITITAEASDEDGSISKVDFFFGSENIGTDDSHPYTMTYNTENTSAGTHIIKAIATDNDGKTKESTLTVSLTEATGLEVISVSQTVSENQTWETGKIYKIRGNTDIAATVTIEPGCIIKMKGYVRVLTDGKILANGTSENPILFTSNNKNIGGDNNSATPEPYDWKYFSLYSTGNVFNYCIFEYGDETMKDYNKDLTYTITNCVFREGYNGLKLSRVPSADTKIENNRFYSNYSPVSIIPNIDMGNTNMFTNEDGSLKNKNQCISFVRLTSTIKSDVTLEETEVAYYTYFTFAITDNTTFTLAENVVFKMGSAFGGGSIIVENGSSFVMNPNSYMTSYLDNDKLGNSCDNIAGASPGSEDWDGIKENGTWTPNMPNVLYSKYSSSK